MAAILGQATFQVVITALGVLRIGGAGEHDFRRPGRQFQPGVGRPRLDDHRVPLRRTGDVQRAVHLEELALVVDGMQAGGIEEQAAGAIENEGVVVPRVHNAFTTSTNSPAFS